MSGAGVLVAVIVALAAAYQGYVSRRVYRSGYYTGNQRVLQLAIIWLIPVVGAVICHFVVSEADSTRAAARGARIDSEDYGSDLDHGHSGGGDGGGD